jgi:ABC-type branched-subunit amino acid transport system substrate-binding protein
VTASLLTPLAHAFGARYDLPVPLTLFVVGGAVVVFVSFLIVLPRTVAARREGPGQAETGAPVRAAPPAAMVAGGISLLVLAGLIAAGLGGSDEVAENIVPTAIWIIAWIAVPISCGVLGDWTRRVNPFALLARAADRDGVRRLLLGSSHTVAWPRWLAWWPAVLLYFAVACGELIYNQTATRPSVTAWALLAYAVLSAFCGMLFGAPAWTQRGELWSVLYATWGRLGWFRFGARGRRGFAGGLADGFEARVSRATFVLLLLVSVSFDGLLSTPAWKTWRIGLPAALQFGTTGYLLLITLIFVGLVLVAWCLFGLFTLAVRRAGRLKGRPVQVIAGLLTSLLPIAFGYLLAHNAYYLLVNGQLVIPLLGDPAGRGWHLLPAPFNDSYEIHRSVVPTSAIWYFQVALIIAVHIAAVVVAHRWLAHAARSESLARRSEWPWIVAMVGYTMTSLWLLAQPIVQEGRSSSGSADAAGAVDAATLALLPSIKVGALFPLQGPMSPLAKDEYQGVLVARDLANQDGGVDGRPVEVLTREVDTPDQAAPAARDLRSQGVQVVLGTYSSELSIPASAAVAGQGMVYWEAGAVADRLTGRGLPLVFRVGADGSRLGENSAVFAADDLAPMLHTTPAAERAFMVVVDDDYGHSVADGVRRGAASTGLDVVGQVLYDGHAPDWTSVLAAVRQARPTVLVLVSHIPDGVAFRRAMLAADLHVDALIGSTMAQCVPDFGAQLGADAVGVFASDRPTQGFNPGVLSPSARAVYDRFASAWRATTGRAPDEEGIAGFSAAWALFHDVLPQAAVHGLPAAAQVAAAARAVDLPDGSLPNGAGLHFSTAADRLGQNERAAAVIWQWQAVRTSVVVWPAQFAAGSVDLALVPLPR